MRAVGRRVFWKVNPEVFGILFHVEGTSGHIVKRDGTVIIKPLVELVFNKEHAESVREAAQAARPKTPKTKGKKDSK